MRHLVTFEYHSITSRPSVLCRELKLLLLQATPELDSILIDLVGYSQTFFAFLCLSLITFNTTDECSSTLFTISVMMYSPGTLTVARHQSGSDTNELCLLRPFLSLTILQGRQRAGRSALYWQSVRPLFAHSGQ